MWRDAPGSAPATRIRPGTTTPMTPRGGTSQPVWRSRSSRPRRGSSWLLVGAPIFLAAWRDGWGPAVAFLGSFVACLVGVHVALAAVAGYGHRRLPGAWHRRLLVTATVALGLVGVGLVWQSWLGNFQRVASQKGVSTRDGRSCLGRRPVADGPSRGRGRPRGSRVLVASLCCVVGTLRRSAPPRDLRVTSVPTGLGCKKSADARARPSARSDAENPACVLLSTRCRERKAC
jgi:hypothetical protein